MLKCLFLLMLPVTFLASCSSESNEIRSFYRDGTTITDSVHLRLVERELPRIMKANHLDAEGIRIYTSLLPNMNDSIDKLVRRLGDSVYSHINWDEKAPEQAFVDSLKKTGRPLLNAGIVLIDNSTGQIICNYSSWQGKKGDAVSLVRRLGGLGRTFLFALAMQEEYRPEDRYPQLQSGEGYSPIHEGGLDRTFYNAIAQQSGGGSPYGLGQRYSQKQVEIFLDQLQLDAEDIYNHPAFLDLSVSLTAVTKTYTAFYNGGILHVPTVIDSITDAKGKVLYRNQIISKRILNKETSHEMIRLLDYYAHEGIGRVVEQRYEGSPDFIGNFAKPAGVGPAGYFIAITKKYTVGIFSAFALRDLRVRSVTFNQPHGMTVPIWLEVMRVLEPKRNQNEDRRVMEQTYPVFPERKETPEIAL